MKRLDSCMFDRIDYMKIDCEGYEMQILKGGENIIRTHEPSDCS